MQTYWDGATNRWVTKLPDGSVRAATNQEALLAYSNGAQAPVGSTGPKPDPAPAAPAHILYFDAATGQYSIDDGAGGKKVITGEQATTYAGQGWQIKSPTTVDPRSPDDPARNPSITPPAPPPPQIGWGQTPAPTNYGWGTGFRGSQAGAASPFADLSGTQQAYYQLHPDQANYLLRSWLAPNATSPLNQYLAGQQQNMTDQYATASAQPGQAGLQYTDWLKQSFGHYVDQFAGQSATQRQENPLMFGGGFAGRNTS
jgi:hypothetical protein